MEVESPGDLQTELASSQAQTASIDDVFRYVGSLLGLTMGASQENLATLLQKSAKTHLQRFVESAECPVLYVQKHRRSEGGHDTDLYDYTITTEMESSSSLVSSLALIKRSGYLTARHDLQQQIQILNLPGNDEAYSGTSAYESLHGMVKLALSPYLDSIARSRKTSGDSKGIPSAKKKLAELELSLLYLQQNIEIPRVVLAIHPIVQQAVDDAKAENRRPTIGSLRDSAVLTDMAVMNSIQATTLTWRQQIKQIVEKDRDPSSGSASQEINFWLNFDEVMADVELQLKSDSIALTFEVLAAGKRIGVNSAMISQDTGLKDTRERVKSYNLLMRDFPIGELLSAPSLEKTAEAVNDIFDHISRRLRTAPYPVARAIPLVEAITRDIENQVTKLLRGRRLMHLDFNKFDVLLRSAEKVFGAYEHKVRDFITTARDVLRKRNEKFLVIKVNPAHANLQDRLTYLHQFRLSHEKFFQTMALILAPTSRNSLDSARFHDLISSDALQEIAKAFLILKDIDVLDVSFEGTETWNAAENDYDERIAGVENSIIHLLRARLDAASSANDMFRIFSEFNALFIRPKIRGAIQEYQDQLVEGVKHDIARLQNKFIEQYVNSDACRLATQRDVPLVSGHIIWLRQMNRQLDSYIEKLETVLGEGWHLYAEGQKLYSESTSFRKRLDTKPIFEQWLSKSRSGDQAMQGPVLTVRRVRANNNHLALVVNFDEQAINLFKEVRNLLHLGFNIPHQTTTAAKTIRHVYPHAMRMIDGTNALHRLYNEQRVSQTSNTLLASFQNDVRDRLLDVYGLHWEPFREEGNKSRRATQVVLAWVQAISLLQAKTDFLAVADRDISALLSKCQKAAYDTASLKSAVGAIQTIIDNLSLEGFSNLTFFVGKINEQLEAILSTKTANVIDSWMARFTRLLEPPKDTTAGERENTSLTNSDDAIDIPYAIHEIILSDQLIHLEPPIEHTTALWSSHLTALLNVVSTIPRLRAARFELDTEHSELELIRSKPSFSAVLQGCVEPSLRSTHRAIREATDRLQEYYTRWLHFQALWDLQLDDIWSLLDRDLSNGLQLLSEIRKARSTFDTTNTVQHFPHACIKFDQVQARINAKYDAWQRDIVNKFGEIMAVRSQDFFDKIHSMRTDLELHSLDSARTANAIAFITSVQTCRKSIHGWGLELVQMKDGESALRRNRYQFPSQWLSLERVEGEWETLQEIFQRRNKVAEDQADALTARLRAEDTILLGKIEVEIHNWHKQKPHAGDVPHTKALDILEAFRKSFNAHKEETIEINKAKLALDLEASSYQALETALEELQDFSSVWTAVSSIWSAISNLETTLWVNVIPRDVRASLDGLLNLTKEMPSRMRQYSAFEYVQSTLNYYIQVHSIIKDLKSEALKERHWLSIWKLTAMRDKPRFSVMTLGDIWKLDLTRHEKSIKQLMTEAQGEFALEEFLAEVRDRWQVYEVELVNYKNKTRLIRNWDDIFAFCSEYLNSLAAMKYSPYYKVFQSETEYWESRITRVHILFDSWVDVQRQWVYLEAIFVDNVDIRQLLPVETSRFTNLTTDLLSLMRRVNKAPLILNIIEITEIQAIMGRFTDSLHKIQKALGDYLERERTQFPRFYFVGDEDLLEMIGNASELSRTQIHLKKMFAGISSLITDVNLSAITGFRSSSGEEVLLHNPIRLDQNTKVHQWLKELEVNMKTSLCSQLWRSMSEYTLLFSTSNNPGSVLDWMSHYPVQILILTTQCLWTSKVEDSLIDRTTLQIETGLNNMLSLLASLIPTELTALQRTKCESMITSFVHQRDVCSTLIAENVSSIHDFHWLCQLRFYMTDPDSAGLNCLLIRIADAEFSYGFEYLGAPDRLVQTPLTNKCFLTMTQALQQKLGGSPFGPAGTGKTETVKALGTQLGRFVLVFNCDDTFDFQAMGRIFLGLCQVGAWGCFDEFNRLEERILSAVSQQIQTIQAGLSRSNHSASKQIELLGRTINIHDDTGIFITMNPNYAGRSNLPDNLKKLFRSIAMSRPDKVLIAQVTFYTQGFVEAARLAALVVKFFDLCTTQLSDQPHYDFGLRALKSVLISCGNLRREQRGESVSMGLQCEEAIVLRGLRESIMPKLVGADPTVLLGIVTTIFPNIVYTPSEFPALRKALVKISEERGLVTDEAFLEKTLQLYQLQVIHHGIMLVGEAGTGKTQTWKLLSDAMKEVEGMDATCYTIDAKVISKETLYGRLDMTTREWTDGLFTSTIRKIIDNLRGENNRRNWIIFDGDVDPEWVENMNSVLDDNRLLTLANGERLALPQNTRIMFEVANLRHATPATVSRCGMIYFNQGHVRPYFRMSRYMHNMHNAENVMTEDDSLLQYPELRTNLIATIETYFTKDGLVLQALNIAMDLPHIMEFSSDRALVALFTFLDSCHKDFIRYANDYDDFPLTQSQITTFISRKLLLGLVWSFAGDCSLDVRHAYSRALLDLNTDNVNMAQKEALIDFDVKLPDAAWLPWQDRVPKVELDPGAIYATNSVIPTVDTLRHKSLIHTWLYDRKPFILCGPPGSGKTMILFETLRTDPTLETVGLNFSSATTPELIIKTLEQYCEYKKTINSVVLCPAQTTRWLVLFCDEINLPALDKYGTQRAIFFLRQLLERQGFWRERDRTWVAIERVQFVGACNPPTDVGRTALSPRFLRHVPVLMVDYPGDISMRQIYSTFARAALKYIPNLQSYAGSLADAMVDLYDRMRGQFTTARQPHYIYSPRELTRWIRGITEAIRPLEVITVEGLIRIWAHEAHRLFADRLVSLDERVWAQQTVELVALKYFPNINQQMALQGPILYSNWLSKHYVPVDRDQLRQYIRARLRSFCEEEINSPLVLYDEAIEQVLKIDRVFRQPQGHMILIGISGSGKTTLTRFVAWMNGLSLFQIKVHGKYNSSDFDNDLRDLLRRCGTRAEKICFVLDESNILDTAFLERMNTLLANAEIPGLFEAEDFSALLNACKEGSQRDGLFLDTKDELYLWFTQQVAKNLHVVFTMNPPDDLSSKAATSPALFNRCVLNWCGNWSGSTFSQVASELTAHLDLAGHDSSSTHTENSITTATYRDRVIKVINACHEVVQDLVANSAGGSQERLCITPGYFLEMITQFLALFNEKQTDLEDQQRHLNVGLDKLQETVDQVAQLKTTLAQKKNDLEIKVLEANEKLQQMVTDQQEAEQKKIVSLEIQEALSVQEDEIAKRRTVVLNDLALAEPAVLDAQASVSNIKKQQLTEVRSMSNPPEAVKLAMESVCTLLGHNVEGWRAVQSVIRRDDFISSIVHFDNEAQMSLQLRDLMKNDYMTRPSFQYEAVNRASKACGPLVQWVAAQVNYSDILDRVEPLRKEVDSLEAEAILTRRKGVAIIEMIQELEDSISAYKVEYADLISETQAIKSEMSHVQIKVKRSVDLLHSLTAERERWQQSTLGFASQFETIVGDAVLSAAFLAYSGFFDQISRGELRDRWIAKLSEHHVLHEQDLSLTTYLATADQLMDWQSKGLLTDEVSIENAVLLKRCIRYPLIVDPTGRSIDYLAKVYSDRKLTITSFLDDAFPKLLETALRFGNPILINDAEHFDPMLNRVLNKEYQKSGGRTLVTLGKQDIDISPTFKMYFATRNSSIKLGPEIASRVSIVNFTITRASMESQTLHTIMKVERPDIEERRSTILKAQGEYQLRLRRLEQDLLEALSLAKGNILDDDNIVSKLEVLKRESDEISIKVSETVGVVQELEVVTHTYAPIGKISSSIFASLERLNELNHFYRFSLEYFESVFMEVVRANPAGNGQKSQSAHIERFVRSLIVTCFGKVSQTMLHRDQLSFALLLTDIFISRDHNASLRDQVELMTSLPSVACTDIEMARNLLEDKKSARLLALQDNVLESELLEQLLSSAEPWNMVMTSTQSSEFEESMTTWKSLSLIKLLRADCTIPALVTSVHKTLDGPMTTNIGYDLHKIVTTEIEAATPVLLASSPGYDAAYKVDALVRTSGMACESVAMGARESLILADRALNTALQAGSWVLIKNVHLAISWLQQLEKRLLTLKPHKDFRLFLTMEASPHIPASLIQMSRVFMYEAPPGLRANIIDSVATITQAQQQEEPVERARLYFLLAWLHAVIQERLRYTGIGWSKAYEFNDSDFAFARQTISSWLTMVAGERTNIAPNKIPWGALQTLLSESIYGGKVDEPVDQEALTNLVKKYFSPAAFELDYMLVDCDSSKLQIPDVKQMGQFMQWVHTLPENEPPTWLGLHEDAQTAMRIQEGDRVLASALSLMTAYGADSM